MWTSATRKNYSRNGLRYQSDVTDEEWCVIEPYLPPVKDTGRPRGWPLRERLLRDRSLRFAFMNIAVGEKMAAQIKFLSIPDAQIRVIPNWANDEESIPVASPDNPLRAVLNLQDKLVGYSGNLGRADEFDTMLGAAERLCDNSRLSFCSSAVVIHSKNLPGAQRNTSSSRCSALCHIRTAHS